MKITLHGAAGDVTGSAYLLETDRARVLVDFGIVGYQGEGSLGRRLVDGAKSVKIHGETIAVKARIHTLNGFSAHAGQSGLMQWLAPLAAAKPRVVLVHGEARGREPLAKLIRQRHGLKAALPMQGDVIKL